MPDKNERELLIDALVRIRTLKKELELERSTKREPIAIVGAGCRFPGGVDSLESYWTLLRDGVDGIGPMPAGRYDTAHYSESPLQGGFLHDVASFDAEFFGISPREAIPLDPQQRLLLEVGWEALENAGLAPDQQSGTSTGVYVGVMAADYAMRQAHSLDHTDIDPYMLTGNDLSFSAGRLSYFLGLHGPVMAVTTACSSSLVAVHLACQALRARECDQALAGGVNVILDPVTVVMLTKLGALAKDGRSKGFDAAADGYGRGEGCGLVVLKRLSDAAAAGDRIIAVIRGSAVNHDGAGAGLTVPNGMAQERLIRKALDAAGVQPNEIDYVEAHGTGTPLGDPIEVQALARVFGKGRVGPLLIGSVKSNFGHLESAAGIAGLLKTALALQHGALPQHLHFRTPNPHVSWKAIPVQVVDKLIEWPRVDRPSCAGVSSFGLSGVNAHAVLEQAPFRAATPTDGRRHVLTLSARTASALTAQAQRYRQHMERNPDAAFADVCQTANMGRSDFAYRLAITAQSAREAATKLRTGVGEPAREAPKVAFVFVGENVRSQLEQYERWRSWAVEPEIVAGEGLGEYAAACAAGVFSIEDAERLSAQVQEYATASVAGGDSGLIRRAQCTSYSGEIVYSAPKIRLISSLTGELANRELTSPDYWRRTRNGSRATAADTLAKLGISVVIRISDQADRNRTLETIAELYALGASINWGNFCSDRPRNPVPMPTYPFERSRYWALDPHEPTLPEAAPEETSLVRAIEKQVAVILGMRETPNPDASLLDLGLDSLMAAELCSWAKVKRSIDAHPSDVHSAASIEELARLWEHRFSAPDDEGATAENAGAISLSYGQKALWFIHQSDPGNVAYNVGIALRIRSLLNVNSLRGAFQSLVDRHPSLRATFKSIDGEPVQVIQKSQEVCFAQIEVTADGLSERVTESCRQPFDLENGPLLRVSLYTCSPDDNVLLIAMHHIVCDALSYWSILEELQTLYAGGILAPAAASYSDFVRWQQNMIAAEDGERHSAFWHRQLAGELPVLNLPLDFPRPAVQQFVGGSHALPVPASLTQALRDLSRRERVTLYTTLLTAFHTLLHRYSGQDDIIVGSATAGRPSRFTGVVGYFVNPVPIRADLSGNPSFLTLLDQIRRTALDALDHQLFPFPLLVERLKPKRDASRSPIFQVDFALRKHPPGFRSGTAGASGLSLEPFEMAEEEGQFDLSLHITEEPADLTAVFKFNPTLFGQDSIGRMARCFLTLLENIASEPSKGIDEIALLSAGERERLLEMGQGLKVAYPDTTLPRMFERQARETPDATAAEMYGEEELRLTYRELELRTNQLAHHFRGLGVGAETLVGICLPRGLNLVTAILGVLKAGGAYVPLDATYPAERLAFLMEDASMPVLITDNASLPTHPAPGFPADVRLINMDTDGDAIGCQSESTPNWEVGSNDLAYVIYTSGSTGKPKGALITHRGLTNYLCWAADSYKADHGCGAPVNTAIGFDATITSLFVPLVTGGKILLLPERNTIESLTNALLSHRDFSLVKLTPAHLEILSQTMPAGQCGGRANAFIIGGEALRGDTLAFWQKHAPATRLINEYGPTETVVGCCVYEASEPIQGSVPIGRPIANTRLYVLDSKLQPVPFSVTGELYIGGAGVARGYLNRPELTASLFLSDPFSTEPGARMYRTGDLVRYLPNGNLDFLGRTDTQVKLRGYRIETGEIESVLRQHPAVTECVVVLREDQPGNRTLAAYVVRRDELLPVAELRRYLSERLPEYMLPSAFVVLDSLPLTPNGKIDRRALPAPTQDHRDSQIMAPRDPLELKLVAVWEQVLGRRPVGVTDNFFDLGGHSLLAVRLMARMQDEFGENIALATILRGPTIEQMARILRQQSHPANSPVVSIQPSGTRPPFFCVPGAGGNVIYLHSLAQQLGPEQPFYGLQGAGLDGESSPHTTVEEMADYYIAAVRSVQPEGPYYFGGHSLGGWVAYEMARRLERQGQAVAALAIIDTPAPVSHAGVDRESWDNARWISELASRIAQLLNPRLSLGEEYLRGLDPEEQLKCFQQALVKENLFPADADTTHLRNVLALFKAHSQVRYCPPLDFLTTPISLFRTSIAPVHLPTIAGDAFWGWGAYGNVEMHSVPGEHLTVLRAPHVETLAQKLSASIAKAHPKERSWQPL
jgi:amino acid adenylation domain-containing protein